MRCAVLLLILAACGTAWASPVPSGDVDLALPSDDVDAESRRKGQRVIPVSMTECSGEILDSLETEQAKYKFVEWAKDHMVKSNTLHMETTGSSTWWICNCKMSWHDGVPKKELDDVQYILDDKCAPNEGGWVWSKKWEKGFNLRHTDYTRDKTDKELCPPKCIDQWDPNDTRS